MIDDEPVFQDYRPMNYVDIQNDEKDQQNDESG